MINRAGKDRTDRLCRNIAKKLLEKHPSPTEDQVTEAMILLIYYHESAKTRDAAIS